MVPVLLQQGNPMTKLTDIQLVILTAAYQRPTCLVLPLPERLKGGAAHKVVGALLTKDLVEEVLAGAGDPVWRQPADGHAVTLVATNAAVEALGIEATSGLAAASTGAPAAGEFRVRADWMIHDLPLQLAWRADGRPKLSTDSLPTPADPPRSPAAELQAL